MKSSLSKNRIYAILLMAGAGILLLNTIKMMTVVQAFEILVAWAIALLLIEFTIDLSCLICSLLWYFSDNKFRSRCALRLGATAAILHAFRVLIYVLGRTGPWVNFDVKQEYRESYTFDWFWVYFAATLSILGIAGVIIIWLLIRRKHKQYQ